MQPVLAAQQGRLALWLPVFMGAGVLLYFSLRFEPPIWAGAAVALPAVATAFLVPFPVRLIAAAVAAGALGFAAAQLATAREPPLHRLPHRALELAGTVQAVEVLPQGVRVTLEPVRLDGGAALRRSLRVRLRPNDPAKLAAGDEIQVRALAQAPSPPAYPGAWDLQRDAFFSGLSGYGFAIGPVTLLAHHPATGLAGWLQALRETIARRFEAVLPGAEGAVAATLLTGVPTAIPASDREAFRASGLAHLLAVAGLHIGIVMGLAFAASRALLALSEHATLYWPTKQIAALAALAAGGFYMLLTGMHVPIMRSFAMASLFTLAVLIGRRPLSMRGLAVAAAVLIVTEPQQVPGVSFQMSFSAVLALIAGYEAVRPHLHALLGDGARWRRLALYIVALALTSALAGTASAPFGAYHFGRIQLYFVLANMIAVPLTALWVMPAGLIALGLLPLGLERLALVPMGWGLAAVLWVARTTAGWPDAIVAVPHMPGWGLALVGLGMAWLGLWRGKLRLLGTALIAAGLISPIMVQPPDLLVSADARLVGVRTEAGVFVQHQAGASKFTRDAWEQYWADGPPMPFPRGAGEGANRAIRCSADACLLRPRPGAAPAVLLRGDDTTASDCGGAQVVLAIGHGSPRCLGAATVIDRETVWRQGAAAVWLRSDGARVVTDRDWRGVRPWIPTGQAGRREAPIDLPPAPAGART